MRSHGYFSDARSRSWDCHTYNGLKVHFSTTVGEKPEVEVGLVAVRHR
jgi:hypothetical protein